MKVRDLVKILIDNAPENPDDLFTNHHLNSEVVFSIVKDTEEDADVCLKYESSTYNDDEDALEINLSIEGGIVYET